ncbi:MAG TPA: flavin reductase family protein [Candidatus Mediterraneibacter avicola]|nr:flavin reductase family protein [Candidatus Mediterraneibacter avicola]
MSKQIWKPGNMLYPLPAVMVSTADPDGNDNIITIAWTGTVCTNPPMTYISVRPGRHSYHMIKESGEFVINLTTERLMRAADFCGVRSGRDTDKWKQCGLTRKAAASLKYAPVIEESPVNIECQVVKIEELGSHHMFLARVTAVQTDETYMDEKGKFELNRSGLVAYSHGEYLALGKKLGTFGCSVKKKTTSGRSGVRKDKTGVAGKSGKRIQKKRMKGQDTGKR